MLPSSATHNVRYGGLQDTVLFGKGLLQLATCMKLAYFQYLIGREPRRVMGFAKDSWCAARSVFLSHILHVVLMCAQEEMVWIHAQGVIASMKNPKIIRDFPKVEFIREAMGHNHACPILELPVSMRGACLPFPTLIWAALVHFLPKALFRRWVDTQPVLVADDKAHGLAANIAPFGISVLADGGRFATTTFTQLFNWRRKVLATIMAVDKAQGFSLDPSFFATCLFNNLGSLSATTVAIAVWDFLRGILRGMIWHVNSPFVTLTTPPDDSTRRGGNFIGFCSFNYTTGKP